jgi:hypothetical protein
MVVKRRTFLKALKKVSRYRAVVMHAVAILWPTASWHTDGWRWGGPINKHTDSETLVLPGSIRTICIYVLHWTIPRGIHTVCFVFGSDVIGSLASASFTKLHTTLSPIDLDYRSKVKIFSRPKLIDLLIVCKSMTFSYQQRILYLEINRQYIDHYVGQLRIYIIRKLFIVCRPTITGMLASQCRTTTMLVSLYINDKI